MPTLLDDPVATISERRGPKEKQSFSGAAAPQNTGDVLTFHFLLEPSPLFTHIVDQELLSLTISWME